MSDSSNRRNKNSNQNRKKLSGGGQKRRPENRKKGEVNRTKVAKEDVRKNKNGKKKMNPKVKKALKIAVIVFLLLCVIGAGIVAGIFFGLFGDEFEISKDELQIKEANSVVVDANGAVIANLSGDEKRKIITLEDMSQYLPKAYVAIEDERFYKHHGVDWKRTAGAIFNTIFKGSSSYGGSTITQQLVKNLTEDNETSGLAGIYRKIREWAKAYQVERMISKDQILELYLNILYVGGEGNLHGVELRSRILF